MIKEWLIKCINTPKHILKKKNFVKNATFLLGSTTTKIGLNAKCVNMSGKKQNICIGHHCDIDAVIMTQDDGKITIGDYTTIRYGSMVGAIENIEIGSYVIISNRVTIYDNNNHPIDPELRIKMCESGFYSDLWKWRYSEHKPVKIGNNVWIGEKSTILKGVSIGEGAVIGCDSVVTHDVEPYTIVAGNPAKPVKKILKI